jgi:hypothetical protein
VIRGDENQKGWSLTKTSCTAPQKQVAVASSSVDQPSRARLARGIYGFDLSAVAAILRNSV